LKQRGYNLSEAMKSARIDPRRILSSLRRVHPIVWRSVQPGRVVTIELQERLPVIALCFALMWYLAAPTAVGLMSIVTFGGLLSLPFLWARAMARRVTARRALQYVAVQVGDELEELVTLDNTGLLPVLWAEFVDRSNLPGYTVSGVSAVESENSQQWRAHAICSQRGVFILGPWELRLGDPFGFFLVRQTYTERQEVLVHPSLAALPPRLLPHGGALGDQRPHRQPLPADTNNAYTTRPYAPGDPLRYVHWRTTARHGSPYVKMFEPEAASKVWLIPDCDAGAHCGESEETMVTLVASLAAQLLQQQLSIGLLLDGETLQVVAPQRGTPHLWTLLRALAPLRTLPDHPLARTLDRARSIVSASDLAVAVTPSVTADWARELKNLAWNRRGSGAEALLLDPASFGSNARIQPCISLLAELGLNFKVVRREDVRPIAGAYGALSRWEFMTTATGGIVVKNAPTRAPTLAAQLNAMGSTRGSR
jgi:uncharacterized protein (DUF58 family)